MAESEVVAVTCADVHLSHTAPQARAVEPDWYAAMQRPMSQISDLARRYKVPVLCAGDLFHRWNSPAELINFAIRALDVAWICIRGQHDLPHHNWEDRDKSAYTTVVMANAVRGFTDLEPGEIASIGRGAAVSGCPWGFEVVPQPIENSRLLRIVLIHAYIWANKATAYPGAPPTAAVPAWKDRLRGYDVAIFGDNHKPFEAKAGGCRVYNCGGLMRRHADEIGHRPSVGLIRTDGTITRHYLDCSEDKFTDEAQRAGELLRGDDPGMSDFIAELGDLGPESLDFSAAVRRYIEETRPPQAVARLLLEAIE